MHSFLRTCVAAAVSLGVAAGVDAQPRPAVVELFTSEGCSSCPPAEAYLGQLAERDNVLALAFHVDYWDSVLWHDRFAIGESEARQNNYARSLGLASVYTPQIVVDGRENYVGSDRNAIDRTVAATHIGVPVRISLVGSEVLVDLGAQERTTPSEVVLVTYLHTAVTAVGHGENAGRTLREFNVVRSIRAVGRWDGRAAMFRMPVSSFPRDATDVAVLVQASGQAAIIGAATHALQ